MSYSSEEYSGSYTNPHREYTQEKHYYKGSQFGPKLPPTVPSMAYPTLLEQANVFGYDALTHGPAGQGYYTVSDAYGKTCEPKFYVAQCPSNRFQRPFVPQASNHVISQKTCPVENELISEGFTPTPTPTPTPSTIVFPSNVALSLFVSDTCPHSKIALAQIHRSPTLKRQTMIYNISTHPENIQKLTNMGGFATPYFYASNGKSFTGTVPDSKFLEMLGITPVKEGYGPVSPMMPSPSQTSTPIPSKPKIPLPSVLQQRLQQVQPVELYVMDGCMYCDKLKKALADEDLLRHIKVTNARNVKVPHITGFPHMVSHKTGKSVTGYDADLNRLLSKLAA